MKKMKAFRETSSSFRFSLNINGYKGYQTTTPFSQKGYSSFLSKMKNELIPLE